MTEYLQTDVDTSDLPKYHFCNMYADTYDLSRFIKDYNHPILEPIRKIVFAKYRVVMKFIQPETSALGTIYINNKWLCTRKSKFSPIQLAKGVKLIEGTPTKQGGSNQYPTPCFKEGYCILEFNSNGLPVIAKYLGWTVQLITLEELNINKNENSNI